MSSSSSNKRFKTLSTVEQVAISGALQLVMDFVPELALPSMASVCQLWKKAASQSYSARINKPWPTLSEDSSVILSPENNKEDAYFKYCTNKYKQQCEKYRNQQGYAFSCHLHAVSEEGNQSWRLRTVATLEPHCKDGEEPLVQRKYVYDGFGVKDKDRKIFVEQRWLAAVLQTIEFEHDLPALLLNENYTMCVHQSMNIPTGLLFLVFQRQWTEEYLASLQSKGLKDSFLLWSDKDEPGIDYWGVLYHVSSPFTSHVSADLVDCKPMVSSHLPVRIGEDIFQRSANGKVMSLCSNRIQHGKRDDVTLHTFELTKDCGIQCNHAAPIRFALEPYTLSFSPAGDWLIATGGDEVCMYSYNKRTRAWSILWAYRMDPLELEAKKRRVGSGFICLKSMRGFFSADGDFWVTLNVLEIELGRPTAKGKCYSFDSAYELFPTLEAS